MKRKISYALFSTIFLIDFGFSFLDISELSSFHYSIDISNQPVILDESKEDEGLLLSSKHGQKYQCQFESLSHFSQKVREEEENASKTNVSELLQPLEERPCLIQTTGWWTYEFCYKKHIKQYHINDQKVVGDVVYLGSYVEEFRWNMAGDKKTPEVIQRYHSQQYGNGSVCDLTGNMRSAEVRFKCKEDSLDAIEGVEEPSTCRYLVHASTSRLCKHPFLKPVASKKSLPITCSPVLDDSDYKDYVELQQKMAEERKTEEVKVNAGKGSIHETDLSINDLDKTSSFSSNVDGGEFGFIEIGNTRIKFYVLNYDGTTSEDEKKDASSDSEESLPSDKDQSSLSSLVTTSTTTPSSLESPTSSSSSSSDTTLDDSETEIGETLKVSLEEGQEIPDGLFGDDTKEFIDIYKRLLSNKKLKSFIKKGRPFQDKIQDGGVQVQTPEDGEQTPALDDEVQTQIPADGTQTISSDVGGQTETLVNLPQNDEEISTSNRDKQITEKLSKDEESTTITGDGESTTKDAESATKDEESTTITGDGESTTKDAESTTKDEESATVIDSSTIQTPKSAKTTEITSGTNSDEFVLQYNDDETNVVTTQDETNVVTTQGETNVVTTQGETNVVTTQDETTVVTTQDETKVVTTQDDLEKNVKDVSATGGGNVEQLTSEESKEVDGEKLKSFLEEVESDKTETHIIGKKATHQLSNEHTNLHHMIMAIIRQSDRSSKEVIRHEDMMRNYDFNWKKTKHGYRKQKEIATIMQNDNINNDNNNIDNDNNNINNDNNNIDNDNNNNNDDNEPQEERKD